MLGASPRVSAPKPHKDVSSMKALAIALIALGLTACANHTANPYAFIDLAWYQEVAEPSSIEVSETLHARGSGFFAGAAVPQHSGIFPGTYVAKLENDSGTLYFGSDRPVFSGEADKRYLLLEGGIWVPKFASEPVKIFWVHNQNTATVGNIAERANPRPSSGGGSYDYPTYLPPAASLQQGVGVGIAMGIIAAAEAANDGKIQIMTPYDDQGFSERLNAVVRPQLEQ